MKKRIDEQKNYQDKLYIHMYLQTESEKQDENILKPEKLTREKLGENLEASHLKTLLRLTKIVNALEPRPRETNQKRQVTEGTTMRWQQCHSFTVLIYTKNKEDSMFYNQFMIWMSVI